MQKSDSINELATALCKAQGVMEGAKKSASNPFFKSKYADLSSCIDAYRSEFAKNGLSVIQANHPAEGGVQVSTMILHTSGQWIADDGLFVPANKLDAQGFGSALTYARRYSLSAMVGLSAEDDDGNAAAASPKAQDGLSKADLELVDNHHAEILTRLKEQGATNTMAYFEAMNAEHGIKAAVWAKLNSRDRAALKAAHKPEKKDAI